MQKSAEQLGRAICLCLACAILTLKPEDGGFSWSMWVSALAMHMPLTPQNCPVSTSPAIHKPLAVPGKLSLPGSYFWGLQIVAYHLKALTIFFWDFH